MCMHISFCSPLSLLLICSIYVFACTLNVYTHRHRCAVGVCGVQVKSSDTPVWVNVHFFLSLVNTTICAHICLRARAYRSPASPRQRKHDLRRWTSDHLATACPRRLFKDERSRRLIFFASHADLTLSIFASKLTHILMSHPDALNELFHFYSHFK